MKWLKLDCDFRNDPKILCLIQQFGGKEACSFWVLLLAYVGANGMPECEISVSENGPHSPGLIASFLCTKPKVALTMLSACAQLGLIQPERWVNDRVISIPNMLKRVDDYTRKVRTKTVQSPEKPGVEQKKNRRRGSVPLPIPIDSPNTDTSPVLLPSAPAEKRAGRLDSAYEAFVEVFDFERAPARYRRNQPKDSIQLAALRKAQGLNGQSPPDWDRAIANYFASPVSSPSVADLCMRFADFVKWPLDRFGKPIRGQNAEPETKSAARLRRIRETTERINRQILGEAAGSAGRGDGAGANCDLPAGTLRLKPAPD